MVTIGKRIIFRGALIGALTSLPVMYLSYLGQKFAGYTFLPLDLYTWSTRFFPGSLIISNIIYAHKFLPLGDSYTLTYLIPITGFILSIFGFIFIGSGFGGLLGLITRFTNRYTKVWGWLGGFLLLIIFLYIELIPGVRQPRLGPLILGTTFLCLGWGWVMGSWVNLEMIRNIQPVRPVLLSRRRFLIYLVAGSITTLITFLGILQYEQQHEGPIPNTQSQPNNIK